MIHVTLHWRTSESYSASPTYLISRVPQSPQEEPKQKGSGQHYTSWSQYYFSKMIYYFYFMCMNISCMYIYIHEFFHAQHTWSVASEVRGGSDLLELEIRAIVRHPVGAGNWTSILCKSVEHSNCWVISLAPQINIYKLAFYLLCFKACTDLHSLIKSI